MLLLRKYIFLINAEVFIELIDFFYNIVRIQLKYHKIGLIILFIISLNYEYSRKASKFKTKENPYR